MGCVRSIMIPDAWFGIQIKQLPCNCDTFKPHEWSHKTKWHSTWLNLAFLRLVLRFTETTKFWGQTHHSHMEHLTQRCQSGTAAFKQILKFCLQGRACVHKDCFYSSTDCCMVSHGLGLSFPRVGQFCDWEGYTPNKDHFLFSPPVFPCVEIKQESLLSQWTRWQQTDHLNLYIISPHKPDAPAEISGTTFLWPFVAAGMYWPFGKSAQIWRCNTPPKEQQKTAKTQETKALSGRLLLACGSAEKNPWWTNSHSWSVE